MKENGSAGDLCLLYCSGLDEISEGEEYEKLCSKIHEQVQKLHYYTLTHLDIDQPERDQFEKVKRFVSYVLYYISYIRSIIPAYNHMVCK